MFPPSQKPYQPSKPKRGRHASKVACNGNPNPNPRNRRDILIGLGGLYGATSLSGNSRGSAFGAPVSPPDPTNCVPPQVPGEEDANCCPREPHRQDMGPKKEVEKEKEEVLVVEVEYDMTEDVKFDVFINDQGDDEIGPEDSEFAGSFMILAHSHGHQSKRTTNSFRMAIMDLLKDLRAQDDQSIVVTLAPRYGNKPVTIKVIKIKLVPLVEYVWCETFNF
ncbi:hypothetical protein GYH30_017215 [Glycine max]|uniref:polyphenol oxidase A1, chloroplastic-like n=1 Tax=Glycine max TaxID=3847 RepID=UPI0002338091|nr:polyphenol oxidase A1, chloroplastic-like [Glycine max]KAH1085076.1 hypothetical protein GYH30_017215 [Glycine max]|eukprot:XP_003529792.1 polyphenol oxidase A1, chloroplastic-like [Glycine max]